MIYFFNINILSIYFINIFYQYFINIFYQYFINIFYQCILSIFYQYLRNNNFILLSWWNYYFVKNWAVNYDNYAIQFKYSTFIYLLTFRSFLSIKLIKYVTLISFFLYNWIWSGVRWLGVRAQTCKFCLWRALSRATVFWGETFGETTL